MRRGKVCCARLTLFVCLMLIVNDRIRKRSFNSHVQVARVNNQFQIINEELLLTNSQISCTDLIIYYEFISSVAGLSCSTGDRCPDEWMSVVKLFFQIATPPTVFV